VDQDLRQTPLYREIEEHFHRALAPAFGRISNAADPSPSPDGRYVAFTGSRLDRLEGAPTTRVCLADVVAGTFEEITSGPGDDRFARWSPDGTHLAFLSDRVEKGAWRLYLQGHGAVRTTASTLAVEGACEYLAWSPTGRAILLGVAGRDADVSDVQGARVVTDNQEALPAWMPRVENGATENQWRRLWLYDLDTQTTRPVSRQGLNVWEAAWVGPEQIAAIASDEPGEGAWYGAALVLIDLASGREEPLYVSPRQLGLPSAAASGRSLAIVRALCSDRTLLAGDILLFDLLTRTHRVVDTDGVDVTHLAWRDEHRLFFVGLRGLETVYGQYDVETGRVALLWATSETSGESYPTAVPLGDAAFALVLHGYGRFPEVVIVRDGITRVVVRLADEGAAYVMGVGGMLEEVSWTAPDGLEIQGLLVRPEGLGPHPLVVRVHGGPVWAWRNAWSLLDMSTPVLVRRGYAVLHPNPRGSAGRGQIFAEMVSGDVGGSDVDDILSGIDALASRGVADTTRVGVSGSSYGGYMSSWLVTRTNRFAAAIPLAPATDLISAHYTSNIPAFDHIFLRDDPSDPRGRYVTHSPIMHVGRVKTPTLQIAGALDRCTPPTQAVEFYHALREHGVPSELVIYPQEGHGIHQFPAVIDQCVRIVAWFERFMPAKQHEIESLRALKESEI